MNTGFRRLYHLSRRVWGGQSGITGLETAIVLIAFVVVAAVFAFAVITTGLFSSEKAAETAGAGIGEATTTLAPKGAVIAEGTGDFVGAIKFKLTNAAGAAAANLKSGDTLVTYSDKNNLVTLAHRSAVTQGSGDTPYWSHKWLLGAGDALEAGEVVEFLISTATITGDKNALATKLGTNTSFKIELIPSEGAAFTVTRTTPTEVKKVMDLR